MKKLFLLLLILVILPSVYAAESLGTFKINKHVELLQTCDNGVSICTQCAISNVKYPNGTIFISDVDMTPRISDFNYTLNADKISTVGIYDVNGWCTDGVIKNNFNYPFEVTPTGDFRTGTFIGTMLLVALVMLVLGVWMKVPFFGFISGLIIGTSGVYIRLYGFLNIEDLYTQSIAWTCIGVGIFLVIVSAYEWIPEE